jgi:hypothetical protein
MAYAPTNWVDNVTPVDAARMNNIEAGIVALGEGVEYENVWAVGTPYQAGDVVTHNGVNYLAVNDSTGVAPSAAAAPTYVAQDAVTVAGTRLVSTKLAVGDAQPAFRIMGNGKLEWGAGGATVPDANLERLGGSWLNTNSLFTARGAAGTDGRIGTWATGDSHLRFQIDASGKMTWGPGNAAADVQMYRFFTGALRVPNEFYIKQLNVNYEDALGGGISFGSAFDTVLYRGGANILKTDDEFQIQRAEGGNPGLAIRVAGDAYPRFQINADGGLNWGAGAGATDAYIYRNLASSLRTNAQLWVEQALYANMALTADKQVFVGQNAGIPGSASLTLGGDVNLYRSAANQLKTDDMLWAVLGAIIGNVAILGGSGAPTGAIGSAGDFYFRLNGGGAGLTHLYFNNAGSWIGIA